MSTLTKSPMMTSSFRCSGLLKPVNILLVICKRPHSRSLHSFYDLGGHAWIHFHSRYMLGLFQNFDRQVSCTWSNLHHFICWLEIGLWNYSTTRDMEKTIFVHTASTILPGNFSGKVLDRKIGPTFELLQDFWGCAGRIFVCWKWDLSLIQTLFSLELADVLLKTFLSLLEALWSRFSK